jgi:hypothetical protein
MGKIVLFLAHHSSPFTDHFLSVYSALQYGHFAQPVLSIGKNTLGCEFHNCIPGIGHDSGKSARVTSYLFCALGAMSFSAADMAA